MQPHVMGILNVTPDSFFDGGRYLHVDKAVAHALHMVEKGADIIDIGGESTRPGALAISEKQECDRVLPVIAALKKETTVPLSIDSRHFSVIKAALLAGVDMVNDISALQNKATRALLADSDVPVCIMHMQGTPQTMQKNPFYQDVLKEVYDFLAARLLACENAGIKKERIWIDPGFGFGKTAAHNLTLLKNLSFFKTLGCPILVGLSRKSMFGQTATERLPGSLAAAVLAMLQGARWVRTHDVAETKQALAVAKACYPLECSF